MPSIQSDNVVLYDVNGNPVSNNVMNAAAVVTSDTVNLANQAVALYVGVAGDVRATLSGGATITMTALSPGVWHPIRATRIFATGTTATSILYAY